MVRGKSGSDAAARAAATAATRASRPGAMAAAAGVIEQAKKEAESMTPLQVAELPRISISRIGAHPLNPEHRHMAEEELSGLVADIKQHDVLVPVLVATRDKIISYDPDLAEEIPETATLVLIDGHRRWGAAQRAGVTEIPYLLRDDLADPAICAQVFLSSNIHHQKLTPIEEAEGYLRLQKYNKVKQTELGELVGVSQGRVSKTLKLLQLPKIVQEAVSAARISPHAARELLDLPQAERESVYASAIGTLTDPDDLDRPARVADAVRTAVNHAKKVAEEAQAVAKARAILASEGINEIDPEKLFGAEEWRHQLRDDEVAAVREAGELAGARVHDSGRVTYYSTPPAPRHRTTESKILDPESSGQPAQDETDYSNGISVPGEGTPAAVGEEPAADYSNGIGVATTEGAAPSVPQPTPSQPSPAAAEMELALRAGQDAHHGRVNAMRRIVADSNSATLVDILADAVLAAEWIDYDDGSEFAAAAGQDISPTAVEHLLLQGRRPDIHRAALAGALGSLEAEAARSKYATEPWPIVIQRHVRRLADLGHYTLTDYDKTRLGSEHTDDDE
ncbi:MULTISPECIES: ParB/RepB/Spo0J family partition protein [Nocardia]|uniref:ParB/RepB/Spo0J family partition protein n=1 Tax=Nocardia TaxID=1817 RepID=UPI00245543CB|nr:MULTISPECIES: ParB/RepB/Spo0J family partition protein [Nocardia]